MWRLFPQAEILGVFDHAHYFEGLRVLVGIAWKANSFAERIIIAEKMTRHGLIDDRHERWFHPSWLCRSHGCGQFVLRPEIASAKQWNAHRRKIVGRYPQLFAQHVLVRRRRITVDRYLHALARSAEQAVAREAGRSHTGERFQARQQLFVEVHALRYRGNRLLIKLEQRHILAVKSCI